MPRSNHIIPPLNHLRHSFCVHDWFVIARALQVRIRPDREGEPVRRVAGRGVDFLRTGGLGGAGGVGSAMNAAKAAAMRARRAIIDRPRTV